MLKQYFTILNFLLIGAIVYFSVNTFYGVLAMKLDPGQPYLAATQKYLFLLKKRLPPCHITMPSLIEIFSKPKLKLISKPAQLILMP